jgi:phosphoribosyl 1,2-cyclic phosphodiesterase
VRVHLCGVRGSTPAPGASFVRVGGNTSCVAIADDDQLPTLALDAGTGLRNLSALLDGAPFNGTIVLGHLHWDHVMGLPFFPAGDRDDASVHVMAPEQGVAPIDELTRLMSPPLFPITPKQLRGDWTFSSYGADSFEAGGFSVVARDIPHKGGRTMGLRITDGRSTIAYLSDHSPHDLGPGDDGLGALHPAAVELAADVDLLIHDSQFTAAELPGRASWGHCAADYGVTLAAHCRVRRLLLFHHDPSRTDDEVWALRDALRQPPGLTVDVAVEGTVIQL